MTWNTLEHVGEPQTMAGNGVVVVARYMAAGDSCLEHAINLRQAAFWANLEVMVETYDENMSLSLIRTSRKRIAWRPWILELLRRTVDRGLEV